MESQNRKSITLALPHAGIRGFVYLGAIRALEDMGYEIKRVVGTSAGALVGALYCSGTQTDGLIQELEKRKWSVQLSHTAMRNVLLEVLGDISFEDLKIPLEVQVTNLESGEQEYISSGELIPWLIASSNQLVIRPYKVNEVSYVDGAIAGGYGVDRLRSLRERNIIALSAGKPAYEEVLKKSPLFPAQKSLEIAMLKKMSLDSQVNPPDVLISDLAEGFGLLGMEPKAEMIAQGYDITMGYQDILNKVVV